MHRILTRTLIIALSFTLCPWFIPVVSAQWAWGRQSVGREPNAWSVATDAAGNVYCAGDYDNELGINSISFGSIALPPVLVPYAETKSFWVKYDATGTVLWADETISGKTYVFNIATDPSGNLVILGLFTSPSMQIGTFTLTNPYYSTTLGQYFLAKISPSGVVLWAVNDGIYSTLLAPGVSYGGTEIETGANLATDGVGNIYITGCFYQPTITLGSYTLTNTDPSGMTSDIFAAKYTPAGTVAWAASVGGTGKDYAYAITATSSGYVYIAGNFLSPSFAVGPSVISNSFYLNTIPATRAYIAKFSATTGIPLWADAGGGDNGAVSVALASDDGNNVYMTGSFGDSSISFGGTSVTRDYPPPPMGTIPWSPYQALFLVQYSPGNVVTWSKKIESNDHYTVGARSVAVASCGQVWVCALIADTAVIDAGDTFAVAPVNYQVLIAGYNISGGVASYTHLNGTNAIAQTLLACDGAGNVFTCGEFNSTITIGPDVLTATGGSFASGSMYVGKYANTISPPDTTYAHNDTATCIDSNITLAAPSGYNSYLWGNGSTASTINIITAGQYYVYCFSCGSVLVDTFNVTIGNIPDTVYSHKDTAICILTNAVTLNGPTGYASYIWSTGVTSSSILITSDGLYFVTAISGCGLATDTFHVTAMLPDTTYGHKDTAICAPVSSCTLNAPPGYSTYSWNTGDASPSISVTSAGYYFVTAISGCDIAVDSFSVIAIPPPGVDLGNDTSFCIGSSVVLSSPQTEGSNYLWSTGSTNTSIIANEAGTYWLKVTDIYGCIGSDTINVALLAPSAISHLTNVTPDQVIEYGSSVQLNADNEAIYIWKPDNGTLNNANINDPVATPANTTVYTVYGYDNNGCLDSASVTIYVDSAMGECIPTAFTPNGDGLNDIFRPACIKFQKLVDFRIYNRWGQQVFYSANYKDGWDGTFNGAPADMGVYFYFIIVARPGGNNVIYKGDVTLIR